MKDLRAAVSRIVKEALGNPVGDELVMDCAGPIIEELVPAIDSISDDAFEKMMGSVPDEKRLTLGRYEDIEAVAELVVEHVLKSPEVHDILHDLASNMLRSAMEAMRMPDDSVQAFPRKPGRES